MNDLRVTGEVGVIYIIHFDEPLAHARHYVGWASTRNEAARIRHHENGTGSRLMRAVTEAGISWFVARRVEGTRDQERLLKKRKATRRYCPACMGAECRPLVLAP